MASLCNRVRRRAVSGIPMAGIGIMAGGLMLAMIWYVSGNVIALQELQGVADTNTQERLQERLAGEYEGTSTNIQQATIRSEWTDDSKIIGIMIKCEDGTVTTLDADIDVGGGSMVNIPTALLGQMQTEAGNCPTGSTP